MSPCAVAGKLKPGLFNRFANALVQYSPVGTLSTPGGCGQARRPFTRSGPRGWLGGGLGPGCPESVTGPAAVQDCLGSIDGGDRSPLEVDEMTCMNNSGLVGFQALDGIVRV